MHVNFQQKYIIPDWPCPDNILCCSTLRHGGYSSGAFDSFNLGAHVGDNLIQVNKNRQRLMLDWQLKQAPAWLEQTHSNKALNLDQATPNLTADASFTSTADHTCIVMTADCLPILLCNTSGTEVAAIHAGWRGLLSGIISNTINTMHSKPNDLMAWLGPAIGPDAFAINQSIKQNFCSLNRQHKPAFKQTDDNLLANLYTIASNELYANNVKNIFGGNFCTFTNPQQFFSYRRQNITGRMATMITIKTT